MSFSTDGIICLGVKLEDEYGELPWGDKYIDDWWLNECGYERPFKLFDDNGDYINDKEPDRSVLDKYFEHEKEFKKNHPLPVELINYCCSEERLYILAIPESVIRCSRGYPVEIKPEEVNKIYNLIEFIKFITKYFPELEVKVKWYLCSYMD